MKATKIYYEKLFNLGNYENEKIGIEVQLEDGDVAEEALEKAKSAVERMQGGERARLLNIVTNPVSHSAYAYIKAKEELEKLEEEDYPF